MEEQYGATILKAIVAVGQDVALSLPVGARVRSLYATLVTSATVGTRYASFRITGPNAEILWRCDNSTGVAASTTETYCAFAGAYGEWVTVGSVQQGPLPDLAVPEGASLVTVTVGLLAGDQWSLTAVVET
jgi:hypothetical protein